MKLTLPPEPDIVSVLEKVKDTGDRDVALLLPPEPELWSVLSLRTLAKQLKNWGKDVQIKAQDAVGRELLQAYRGEEKDEGREEGGISGKKEAGVFGFFRRVNFAFLSGLGKKWWLGAVAFLGLLFAGLGVAAYYLPKARVTLVVNSSPLVKTLEIRAEQDLAEVDVEKRILPAVSVSVTEEGEFETEATGEKEVGSKAVGEITVLNYDTSGSKGFAQGATLQTEGDLRFSLLEEIEIEEASPSADPSDPDKRIVDPGEISAEVEAKDIGSVYNVEEGTKLNFIDLEESMQEDVYAKAAEDFTGGESRKVSVATTPDQEEVLAKGMEELTKQCEQDLKSKLVNGQKLVTKGIKTEQVGEEYSPEIGEEGEEVSLRLRIRCDALAYSEDQLVNLVEKILSDLVPEGFVLSEQEREINILAVEDVEDGGLVFQVGLRGEVLPQVKKTQIRNAIVGQSFAEIESYLGTIPDINSYRIDFSPAISKYLGRLPVREEGIELLISHN
ncbi:MAG: hypothetical protein ACOC4Z_00215 [Patescibacteria group bacterium]